MRANALGGVSLTEAQGCLIVNMPEDVVDDTFAQLHEAVAQRLIDSRLPAMILDFSGVQILDLHEFERIRKLARMADFLGVRVCVVAFNPGIAAFLAHSGADTEGMQFSLLMEDAFHLVGSRRASPQKAFGIFLSRGSGARLSGLLLLAHGEAGK